MCILCKAGILRRHFGQAPGVGLRSTRRGFMAGAAAAGATAAAGLSLFAPRPTTAQVGMPPEGTGLPGRRYVIKGGSVMTMDGGEFAQADVVVEGKKIVAIGYDKLVTMIMGGEVYLSDAVTEASWTIGRQLGLQIAAHILSQFDIRPTFDLLAQGIGGSTNGVNGGPGNTGIGPDNLFIHMTGMSDAAWQVVKAQGAQVSLAVPIEMNMRHGQPPILKLQSLGMEPSLSVDVEVTLTADFFTQMRAAMNQQRAIVNQMTLDTLGNPAAAGTAASLPNPLDWGLPEGQNALDAQPIFTPGAPPGWPPYPNGQIPAPLTTRDVLRFATINGAKGLRLDDRTGSLTIGKEADIIILDATRINVAPLNNVPGAVVSLMDRTNVETVIVAGKIRKWKGQLLDNFTGGPLDLRNLRAQLEASRDFIFAHAFNNSAANGIAAVTGVPKNLFGGQ